MTLERVGVTQPVRHGPYQLRLKFGPRAYCVIELTKGEDSDSVAEKLGEIADVVARLKA